MRFWESSAIVPLIVPEPFSTFCQSLLREDPRGLVWSLAAAEVHSALCRKRRETKLDINQFRRAKSRRETLMKGFIEVEHYEWVKKRSLRLLEVHPLRATDALHLAAALVAFEEQTADFEFVTFDTRLAEAAEKEGLIVIGPDFS